MSRIKSKRRDFYRMFLAALVGGTLSVLYVMILWNVLGEFFLSFSDIPYIRKLLIGTETFSLQATILYAAQNFFVAFVLSFLYYFASAFIEKYEVVGILFYSLFASFAFIFFTIGSMFLAEDVNALLLLFMLDDLFQSIFIMVPIALLAPKRMGALMGD